MKKVKDVAQLIIMMILTLFFIALSKQAKEGAFLGLKMAGEIIIPSLLPLLIIFGYMENSVCSVLLTKLLGGLTNFLFRLPKASATAILFGMIGGYPTGAILTYELYQKDEIDKRDARRMLCFNINGGLPFIVTALGSGVLGNTSTGILLFASTTISAIIIGVGSSFFHPKKQCDLGCLYEYDSFGNAVQKSTESALNAVLKMTAYILLFSAFSKCLSLPQSIAPIMEITNGLCKSEITMSYPLTAFFLAFSGFCIHFQLIEIIKKVDMKYLEFLTFRALHAVISYFVALILFSIFPQSSTVFSNITTITAKYGSVNYATSIILVISAVVLVLDLDSKRKSQQI